MTRPRRILVTDAGRGSAIAVIRSLGRQGYEIVAADMDTGSPGFRSRYTRRRVRYPDPADDPAGTAERILGAVRAARVDLVIPVTDEVIMALRPMREQLERETRLALPSDEQLDLAADKDRTRLLAEEIGVPVPRSITARTLEEALAAADALEWPVVVKPLRSRTLVEGGGVVAHTVWYASTAAELRGGLAPSAQLPVLLQEYWPGEGHGVELLLREGEPLAAFQHRRIREVPPGGGASSFRESVAADPALLDHATRLMAAMRWTGLAMVEFRVGPRGPVLLEVNGRIWGSLPLAVKAGVDFPGGLARLYLDPASARPQGTGYRAGVRSRNLALEVAWIGSVLAGRRTGPAPMPSRLEALRVALRLLWPGDGYDILSTSDPGPGASEIGRIVRSLPGRAARGRAATRRSERAFNASRPAGTRAAGRRPGHGRLGARMARGARDAVARTARVPGAYQAARGLDAVVGGSPGTLAALTYHRIDDPARDPRLEPALVSSSPQEFRTQIEEIARSQRPVSVQEVLDAHQGGRPLPPRAVLVTLDDATRDVAEHAWPILRAAGVPAVLFVPTAFPGGSRPFWWDRLRSALVALRTRAVETPLGRMELDDDRAVADAAGRLRAWVKDVDHPTAMGWVERLWEDAGRPSVPVNALDWDDLRALAADGLALAPHTDTHPLLTRVPREVALDEIRRSQVVLCGEVPSAFAGVFAYPSGAWDPEALGAASEAGIELAFTTSRGVNRAGRAPALALRRINVGSRATPALLVAQLALGRIAAGRGGGPATAVHGEVL